jgi:hypothetical protein
LSYFLQQKPMKLNLLNRQHQQQMNKQFQVRLLLFQLNNLQRPHLRLGQHHRHLHQRQLHNQQNILHHLPH